MALPPGPLSLRRLKASPPHLRLGHSLCRILGAPMEKPKKFCPPEILGWLRHWSMGMLLKKILKNLHTSVKAIKVLFIGKFCLNFLPLILSASPNMMHFVYIFYFMRAWDVRHIVTEEVQNYGKIVFIIDIFENGWWGVDASPTSSLDSPSWTRTKIHRDSSPDFESNEQTWHKSLLQFFFCIIFLKPFKFSSSVRSMANAIVAQLQL